MIRSCRSDRGFARPELMIFIVLIGIGAALAGPVLGRYARHEALKTWDAVSLTAGLLLALCGAVPLTKWGYLSWRDHWRRPKA